MVRLQSDPTSDHIYGTATVAVADTLARMPIAENVYVVVADG